jgi:hypothetical protein
MTPRALYDAFAFPDPCALDKRVFKKFFLENGALTAADKRALSRSVGAITWRYTLKSSTIPVRPYRDGDQEYEEIAVLEVEMLDRGAAARMAEVIHRTIPYPVLLVAAHEDGVQLSAAPRRLSPTAPGRLLATSFAWTPWLDGDDRAPVEQRFLASLHISGLPQTHFQALYEGWLERIVALACAELSGAFALPPGLAWAERRAALNACREMERELRALRSAVRAEASFARQFELNNQIKRLEAQLRRDMAAL